MDPDGDPATVDAPDIVNASWALTGRAPAPASWNSATTSARCAAPALRWCLPPATTALRRAPATAPATTRVCCRSARWIAIWRSRARSSRGPSACDGAVFPRLVAPGVNVRTTDLSHGGLPSYATVSGSSLAAPHVAGVLALLAGAFPAASVAELEAALVRGAQDLGDAGADNSYGHGLVRCAWRRSRRCATIAVGCEWRDVLGGCGWTVGRIAQFKSTTVSGAGRVRHAER